MIEIVQSCPNNEGKEKPQKAELHYVKFKMQSPDGKALANVSLKVKLPGGAIVEKTSDANGLIEIANVKPGNCTVSLNWKTAQVSQSVFYKS